ncbi:MAG: farnesyltranstransferase [Verrucomicrobiaceae bacterium]|jgi:octaprenyl-diphosphate synthase|nr:farnesyltranstransferase [Verrucomicrobiaceae bacterium]
MAKKFKIDPDGAKPLPFTLVEQELDKVENSLRKQVRHFDPGVEPYISYICDTAGKRIRPTLSILVGGATGQITSDHIKLGTILELIHMATLVHDDIIDGASTRRKVLTANSKWGDGLAVLLGDALFSHALMLSTEFDDLVLSRAIASASRDVCQGEILQTQRRFDLTLTRQDYFEIIEMKTGALFAAATDLAAYLSGVSTEVRDAMSDFGMKLGTAYQVYDDCLDLVGSEEQFGKTLRTDLEKGKLTLPMLYLLEEAGDTQRDILQKRIIQQEELDLTVLAGIAEYQGAIARSLDHASTLLDEAGETLTLLGDSSYREALAGMLSFLAGLLATLQKG